MGLMEMGLNESHQFALYSMVENFAFTTFLYFLVVPEASLKDGVLKFVRLRHCSCHLN